MTRTRKFTAVGLAIALTLAVAGCNMDEKRNDPNKADRKTSEESLRRQQKAQPVPVFDYSQYRQNLIEITTAKADATQTTSFFFLEGIGLVSSCPSIGFPIPSTAQLTNPEAKVRDQDLALPQVEPTGVYTGHSTGTYTICIDGNGRPYASYWEGYVQTVTGPAEFRDGQVVLTGKPTGEFTKGK